MDFHGAGSFFYFLPLGESAILLARYGRAIAFDFCALHNIVALTNVGNSINQQRVKAGRAVSARPLFAFG